MAHIEQPISGFVSRESVETFAAKLGADELAPAITAHDIVRLKDAGIGGKPFMVVANQHYTVSVLVRQAKAAIADAVERGYLDMRTAAHMQVLQEGKEGAGAVALEFVAYDPGRAISRAIKSADERRQRNAKALQSGASRAIEGESSPGGKYANILAEGRMARLDTMLAREEPETVVAAS